MASKCVLTGAGRILVAMILVAMAGAVAAAPVVFISSSIASPQPAMSTLDISFEPAAFADLPGWASDDHLVALKTFLRSCR